MALFEEITLTDSIEIRTTPEKVFDFLIHLVDDKSYRIWHPEDHIAFRWLKGKPYITDCFLEFRHMIPIFMEGVNV